VVVTSDAEEALAFQLRAVKIPFSREVIFDRTRRWRFDFVIVVPDSPGIAIEVEGGTWQAGRHTRGVGFEKDCEKYNRAVLLGWRVLRFTPAMIEDGRALKTIEEAMSR
jgi:very-short-patch-repair endonuclease